MTRCLFLKMLLRQQEQAEHEEEHVFRGKEAQNPTQGTQLRTQSVLEEYLPHYHWLRNSNQSQISMNTNHL